MRKSMFGGVLVAVVALAGCGNLQPATIPVIEGGDALNDGTAPTTSAAPAAPAPTPAPAPAAEPTPAPSPEPTTTTVATATDLKPVIRQMQRVADRNSARRSPGRSRNSGCPFVYVPKGKPNPLKLRLQRVDDDGKPVLDASGNPTFLDTAWVLINPRSTASAYRVKRALAMFPEDAGEDELELQVYEVRLTPTPGMEHIDGHNVWWAIQIPDDVETQRVANTAIRIRFENEEGENLFISSQTFTAASNALAVSADPGKVWRIMPTAQPDGTIAHDPVLPIDPTDPTLESVLIRGRYPFDHVEP